MKKEILTIQYSRAFAAFFIVLYHVMRKGMLLGLNNYEFSIGKMSVPFFFIISGYIMGYINNKEKIRFSDFIINRFVRIIPLYYLFTTVILVVFIIKPSLVYYSHSPTITILGSYILYSFQNTSMLLNPGWTLRPELCFYIIFAIIYTNPWKYSKIIDLTIFICLLLSVFSSLFNIYFISSYFEYLYVFAIGLFIYRLDVAFDFKKIKRSFLFFILSSVLLFGYFHFFDDVNIYSVSIIAVFFISIISNENKLSRNNLILKFLHLIGCASFSIYLTHVFSIGVVTLLLKKIPLTAFVFNFTSILLSILVGVLCYLFIEKPLIAKVKSLIARVRLHFKPIT